jgi:hypothetical protein
VPSGLQDQLSKEHGVELVHDLLLVFRDTELQGFIAFLAFSLTKIFLLYLVIQKGNLGLISPPKVDVRLRIGEAQLHYCKHLSQVSDD